jgi:hypothetical protein
MHIVDIIKEYLPTINLFFNCIKALLEIKNLLGDNKKNLGDFSLSY